MSIRMRLTLWYSALLAVSLLLFSAMLYSLLVGFLINVLDERLISQAQQVVNLIQTENDPLTVMISGKVQLPPINVFASRYYIQIVESDGTVVQVSENLADQRLPLPSDMRADIRQAKVRAYTVDATGSAGVRLRVLSAPIVLGQQAAGAVQVAQSLAELDEALNVIRQGLAVGSAAAVLLAALGGVVLARAVLRPIKDITTTAQHITSTQDLAQRIPIAVPTDELGRLSGTINDMLARLQTLFEGQQRLVADVSHELRSPLTTIQGNLDLLRRGAADDPAARSEALHAIGDETARMRRMVNDLLLLAQADAGLTLHLHAVEMDTLLLDVYRQAQMAAQGISVHLGAEDQACVNGDRERLRQLLMNLVDNALKYTPAGGQVTLGLHRSAGWVIVEVADNGIGIGPADLPHIFERFYRADRSRARSGGSGLGLAIAYWIAQAHGGRIEVASQVGQGSTFSVWLPELNEEHAPAPPDQLENTS